LVARVEGVNRILVRGVNWVGDTVLSYPAVVGIRNLFPKAHLAVLAPEFLVDLWRIIPYVDETIPFSKGRGRVSLGEDLRLAMVLRKRRFDLSIIFPRSFHSAFQVYLAGIPVRIGFRDEGRSLLLTHPVSRREDLLQIHRTRYYEKLLEPLGGCSTSRPPRIDLGEGERVWARERLKGLTEGFLIGMNPGATYGLAKCWPLERFGELGKRVAQRWGAKVLLFGKQEERPMGEQIAERMGPGGINLMGETSLLQLAALLERCHVLVTNDTGTMHVAAAVGTRVVALFGSTNPKTTGPCGEGHTVVKRDVSCSPCLKRVCPTDHRCMNLITVEEVEAVVDRMLKEVTQRSR